MWNVVILLLLHENGSHFHIYPLKCYLSFLVLPDLNVILLSCQGTIVNWYFVGFFKDWYYLLCFYPHILMKEPHKIKLNSTGYLKLYKRNIGTGAWIMMLQNNLEAWTRHGIHATKPCCLHKADVDMRVSQSRFSSQFGKKLALRGNRSYFQMTTSKQYKLCTGSTFFSLWI